MKEKVRNLSLYMCSIFQSNSYNDIPKNIMGYNALDQSYTCTKVSEYPNHQWYVHIDNVKYVQL
jgi:hypothetical protein